MWTLQVDIPPPGGTDRPRFGVISKNSRVHARGRTFWSQEAKDWGELMQWSVKAAMLEAGAVAGDADYQITLEVVKKNRKKRLDSQNLVDFISDALEGVLDCDDQRFSFTAVAPVVADIPLIRLTITKSEP